MTPRCVPRRARSCTSARFCAGAHVVGLQACVDEAISECVCKVDRFCCESNWDLRCAEVGVAPCMHIVPRLLACLLIPCVPAVPQMVETTKCGRCPTASAASA